MATLAELMVRIGADVGDFTRNMNDVTSTMSRTGTRISETMNNASNVSNRSTSAIGDAFSRVGAVIAGAFAVDKMKDFAVTAVESASNARAMQAQFQQVFGSLQADAQKTVNELGNQFGMVPSRITPAMSQMTSMFKGLGMDTQTAMTKAKDAVILVADASAFYDKSFEEANASLNSFIKGNYEGGESIGLFANETQLASWASKNLGLDWQKLDEAGKQVARLEYAKAMQQMAGATGQASRESNSYQNQLGNLKATWDTFKAKLAEPFLDKVISGMQGLSGWLSKIDVTAITNGFSAFGSYMRDILAPTFNDAKLLLQTLWDKFKETGGLDTAKSAFEGFKNALSWLKENGEIIEAVLAGLVGGFVAFQILTGVQKAIEGVTFALNLLKEGTLLATIAQWAMNSAMLANPFTWVAIAIGALIAVGILLWKNWDEVSKWLQDTWDAIKKKAVEVWDGVKKWISDSWEAIKSKTTEVWNSIKSWLVGLWDGIKSACSSAWNWIKDTTSNLWNGIKSFLTGLWDGLKSTVSNVFNGVKDTISNVWNTVKSTASSVWEGIKGTLTGIWNGLKSSVESVFNGVKSTIEGIWNGIKSTAQSVWNGIKSAITDPIETAKNVVLGIVDTIKGAFSHLSLNIPKPKIPHVSVRIDHKNIAGVDIPYPNFDLSWNAKGGIFSKATLLGGGNVVGEAGAEAIVPIQNKRYMAPFASAIADNLKLDGQSNEPTVIENVVYTTVTLDGKVVGQSVERYISEQQLDRTKRTNRTSGR